MSKSRVKGYSDELVTPMDRPLSWHPKKVKACLLRLMFILWLIVIILFLAGHVCPVLVWPIDYRGGVNIRNQADKIT